MFLIDLTVVYFLCRFLTSDLELRFKFIVFQTYYHLRSFLSIRYCDLQYADITFLDMFIVMAFIDCF